jgi:hypothetical protein
LPLLVHRRQRLGDRAALGLQYMIKDHLGDLFCFVTPEIEQRAVALLQRE